MKITLAACGLSSVVRRHFNFIMNIDAIQLWEKVKAIALALPETYEKPCYGTPAMYVGKKTLCRLREDDESLALYNDGRDVWMNKDPNVFFITDHYLNYPMLLIHLSKVSKVDLETLLIHSWKIRAGKKLLKAYDGL